MRNTLLQGVLRPPLTESPSSGDDPELSALAAAVKSAAERTLGRSLAIRHFDAGSCNGCELEIHALGNAFYDLERFGFRFVASPRHADMLLVTGPVTLNMREALKRTYDATPAPKWVAASGVCAADGGVFAGSYAVAGAVSSVVPVDLVIPGCPPSPTSARAHGRGEGLGGRRRVPDGSNRRVRRLFEGRPLLCKFAVPKVATDSRNGPRADD